MAIAQQGANHSTLWSSGDIIYIDMAMGNDSPRSITPGQGSSSLPYKNIYYAVYDVLLNPVYPVVFNVLDSTGMGSTYPAGDSTGLYSHVEIPAHGVKLQTYGNSTITIDGMQRYQKPVIEVRTEGPRTFSNGMSMPASIIQGFKITRGGIGVKLSVPTAVSQKPIRTEVRDCTITGNKYNDPAHLGENTFWGGVGIYIESFGNAPTQYVIEHNQIYDQADFFPGHIGPASYGIRLNALSNARDSSLIRGNQLFEQETGIGIYGNAGTNAWVRPRILSNFLSDHEQHIFSVGDCGPILYNDTIFRVRDYCLGPDRRIVYHNANITQGDVKPEEDRTAMIVRNCIFDYHPIAPIEPGGPPIAPYTWPVDTFFGGGRVDVSFTDYENFTGLVPFGHLVTVIPSPELGNFKGRTIPFISTGVPADLHLLPPTSTNPNPLVESGASSGIAPGDTILLDDAYLPCSVRTDVDEDVRVSDWERDGFAVPDRGGDEVVVNTQSGLRLTSTADRTGNVVNGATVIFTLEGVPGDLVLLRAWSDCPSSTNDDVVYNNVLLQPFGNLLLPECGRLDIGVFQLDGFGRVSIPLLLGGIAEMQAYFQAIGLSLSSPNPGSASNRLRIELNN